MKLLSLLILLVGIFPLVFAWRGSRPTSLFHAVHWALAAWTSWVAAWGCALAWGETETVLLRYLALCLTACAGIAVLGARRPLVGPWHFVVLGLLAVLLLPLAERWGSLGLSPLQTVCLAAALAVGPLNYLPTRFWPAALLLAVGCAAELLPLVVAEETRAQFAATAPVGRLALALTSLAALAQWWRRPRPLPAGRQGMSEFDGLWLTFRDSFGLLWAQRLREQFNRAAANADWPVVLRWQGLRLIPGAELPPPEVQAEIVETLRALLKRFGPAPSAGEDQ